MFRFFVKYDAKMITSRTFVLIVKNLRNHKMRKTLKKCLNEIVFHFVLIVDYLYINTLYFIQHEIWELLYIFFI